MFNFFNLGALAQAKRQLDRVKMQAVECNLQSIHYQAMSKSCQTTAEYLQAQIEIWEGRAGSDNPSLEFPNLTDAEKVINNLTGRLPVSQ